MPNNSQIDDPSRCLIVGGGIVGLVMALRLSQVGIQVTCLEKRSFLSAVKDTRTSGLQMPAIHLLEAIGVWEDCEPHSAPMSALRLIDTNRGRLAVPIDVTFAASEIGQDQLGFNVPNAVLRQSLVEHARTSKHITLIENAEIDRLDPDSEKISIHLKSGDSLSGSLLIAADGRTSFCRQALGIKASEHDFEQTALVGTVNHTHSHQQTSVEMYTRGGPLTLVPLPEKTQSSLVWVMRRDTADEMLALDADQQSQRLNEQISLASSGQINAELGDFSINRELFPWPLKSLRAASLMGPRSALIGEAAHILHPIGAQGLNLSLGDVTVLADLLETQHRQCKDLSDPSLLRRYHRQRQRELIKRQGVSSLLNGLVTTSTVGAGIARQLGLRSLHQFGGLKHKVMRQLMTG